MLDLALDLAPGDDGHVARGGNSPVVRLALIGNALPRKCGLATFTSHVADALRLRYPRMALDHYGIDDGSGVVYPDSIHVIPEDDPEAYRDAASAIEASGAGAIWLQHEYGIFGGPAGAHILELIGATSLPLVVTLHTLLETPSTEQRAVMDAILARADHLVVMAHQGVDILRRVHGVSPQRISLIPHGVPDRPLRDPDELKPAFGWQGRKVVMTFGLIAPDKGIEHMIEALPAIVERHPDLLYAIVGATHPNLVRHEGERHREALAARAAALGVADHISFVDKFVEQEELLDMLQASDLYVTPYLNMGQVTSGTLSYAVAVGKPVISTPYIHARELLADGTGILVPPADAGALAEEINRLLDHGDERLAMARRAHSRGREMLWPRVVERALAPLAGKVGRTEPSRHHVAPLPLTAIERMTDGTGILQHGIYGVADRHHGYCIDDNARALILAVTMGRSDPAGRMAELAPTYAAFIQHAWNPATRCFRNFMGYDRRWLESVGSPDSNGRTLWALALTAAEAPWLGLKKWAANLFDQVLREMDPLTAPRAKAFAAIGGDLLLNRTDDERALDLVRQCGEQLMRLHAEVRRDDWHWFEPKLTYDNARLCEALLRAGRRLDEPTMVETGLGTLKWLTERQTGPRGAFRPVGSNGFDRVYAAPLAFDQQPLEATATIDACAVAFAISGDQRWRSAARDAFGWFFGDNDRGVPIADVRDGGCYDGLMACGVNRNQGAESILAVHLAAAGMHAGFGGSQRAGQERDGTAKARIPTA